MFALWLVLLLSPFSRAQAQGKADVSLEGVELAITVDDLPEHGDDIPGLGRLTIAEQVLAALKANKVPQAYGFCNNSPAEDVPVLEAWLKAGYPLGNHTFTHPLFDKVGSAAFIEDIEKEDAQLAAYSPLPERRMFRFPYLREGPTMPERRAVRDYLKANGYRVAEVTVDYHDWAWTDAYARCLARKDDKAVAWLERNVVSAALQSLRWSREQARRVAGRDVKHVLLIHVGAFDGASLGDILAAYRKAGVRFITLEQALADPVYALDPAVPVEAKDHGLLVDQLAKSKKVSLAAAPPDYSVERLGALCAYQ